MNNLTEGKPIKVILIFTLPLLLGNFFQQFYNFIDTLIVGRTISVDALAAVGATGSLITLLIGFAQGVTAGLSILTAQRYGARDYQGVIKSFAAAIWICIVITVLFTALGVLLAKPLLQLMQTPANLMHDAVEFTVVIFLGTFATVAFNLLSNVLRSIGNSRTPLIFLLVATILNVILEFVFILGLHMGVAGAGWATVIAQVLASLLCVIFIYRKIPNLMLSLSDMKFDRKEIKAQLSVGLPMGFQTSIIAIGAIILQVMLNTLGSNDVAAYTVAGKVEQLATLPAMSFGITMATYAAQNFGARKYRRILEGVRSALTMSISFSIMVGLVLIFFGRSISTLFIGSNEPLILNLTTIYYICNASMYFVLSILFIMRYTLQGLGNSRIPTLAGIVELLMRTFAAIVLIKSLGFLGASLASPLAWIGSVCVLVPTWLKAVKVLKKKEALAESGQMTDNLSLF